MVKRNIILTKIAFIREHLERVRSHVHGSLDDFLKDRDRQDVVCFNLVQAIQGCADLASHIVSDEDWGIPSSYKDAFQILSKRKMLDFSQAEVYGGMVGFRNEVVHQYASIDFEEVYKIMTENLSDIDAFVTIVLDYFHL